MYGLRSMQTHGIQHSDREQKQELPDIAKQKKNDVH